MSESVNVTYRIRPTDRQWTHWAAPAERTVAQLLGDVVPEEYWPLVRWRTDDLVDIEDAPVGLGCYEVIVNGEMVPLLLWEKALLEAGDQVVVTPHPGIFEIALANAALAVASGLILKLGTTVIILMALLAFASVYILAALAPSLDFGDRSSTYRVEGIGNRPRHWEQVPKVFGTFRWAPPAAATEYNTARGENRDLTFALDLGTGPVQFNDMQISQVPADRYDDFETTYIEAENGTGTELTDYGHARRTEPTNYRLSQDEYHVLTEPNSEQAVIMLEFPLGLGRLREDGGGVDGRSVRVVYRYELYAGSVVERFNALTAHGNGLVAMAYGNARGYTRRVQGGEDAIAHAYLIMDRSFQNGHVVRSLNSRWYINNFVYGAPDSNADFYINRKVTVSFNQGLADRGGKSLYILMGRGGLFHELEFSAAEANQINTSYTWTMPRGFVDWDEDCIPPTPGAHPDSAEAIWRCPPNVGPDGDYRPTIEVLVADSGLAQDTLFLGSRNELFFGAGSAVETIRSDSSAPYYHDITVDFPEPGRYALILQRLNAESTSLRNLERVNAIGVQSVVANQSPVININAHSIVVGNVEATDHLQGRLENLEGTSTSLIPVYENGAWSEPQTTSNPAWIACYILRDGPRGVDDSQLDIPCWSLFAQHCEARGYNFNGVIDANYTKRDCLAMVLDIAQAQLARTAGRYCVIWNDSTLPMVQVFSPRNTKSLRVLVNYPEEVHAINVDYVDPDHNWRQRQVTVYRAGYNDIADDSDPANPILAATNYESLEALFITNRTQALKYGAFKLAERKYRHTQYTFAAGHEQLVCTRGDVIGLQSFDLTQRICSARISRIERSNDGLPTGFYPDQSPTDDVRTDTTYTARIMTDSGLQVKSVRWYSPAELFRFVDDMGSVTTNDSDIIEDMHFTVGVVSDDVLELRVQDIQYSADGFATITATDWRVAELHSAEGSVTDEGATNV